MSEKRVMQLAAGNGADGMPLTSDDELQFISFTIGTEDYGVDIMAVREIRGWTDTTALPNSPQYVRGVINLRGVIVPIFDLRARFGLGSTDATKTHVVIVVAVGARTIGILVDGVSDILKLKPADVRPVPEMDRAIDDAYLSGLVTVGERVVAVIDLPQLFETSTIITGQALSHAGH